MGYHRGEECRTFPRIKREGAKPDVIGSPIFSLDTPYEPETGKREGERKLIVAKGGGCDVNRSLPSP